MIDVSALLRSVVLQRLRVTASIVKRSQSCLPKSYCRLLEEVFSRAVHVLAPNAKIYIRTDSREFTYRTTLAVLHKVFSDKRLDEIRRPLLRPSQTRLFGKASAPVEKNGEIDLILSPR